MTAPTPRQFIADARNLPLSDASVDLIVTSPPYWKKRDYQAAGQLGQERTPEQFVGSLVECFREWGRVMRPTGSVFLNIGDSYHERSLVGIPGMVEVALRSEGWLLRNRIVWAKAGGMPDPARDRLAGRHEYVLHFAKGPDYFYDLLGYAEHMGNGANPGDVWHIEQERNMSGHLAPFPSELARRAILLACPERVCSDCGLPRRRIIERTRQLDPERPQARRAMELAEEHGLSDEHIAAIQATGVSDAGKALRTQTGTGRNSAEVRRLAAESKAALGGYFREFTFAKKVTTGWSECASHEGTQPGVVLDPFVGTGTTLRVASDMGRRSIGSDLDLTGVELARA